MRVGVIFPQTEIGTDPGAIRDYAQAAEALGYEHIIAYDHVLGADPARHPGWSGPYTSATPFHEPFVLFGYLAGLTRSIELVTGVIILPQRQTALVAKQAAEVDLLSGGRLRLGIGVGWNPVEYAALGQDFTTRGTRSEEQIALLRQLWAASAIDFAGRWDTVTGAGINPLPPRGSIPIWIGGYADATLRRVATLGEGWFPWIAPDEKARAMLEQLRAYTLAAGRNPAALGIDARLSLGQLDEHQWAGYAAAWRALGATHLSINTMGAGFATPQAHIDGLRRAREVLGL